MSTQRETGGNRFIDADASLPTFVAAVRDQLRDLRRYAELTDRKLDLSAITVETRPTRDGRLISVSVMGDLAAAESPTPPITDQRGANDE